MRGGVGPDAVDSGKSGAGLCVEFLFDNSIEWVYKKSHR